jgi:hypothetical protein
MFGTMVSTSFELGGRWRDNPNLVLALELAAQGWFVVPFSARNGVKLPIIPGAHPEGDPLRHKCAGECGRDGHGYNDAAIDAQKIESWWAKYPSAIVGINCQRSGLIALDFDRPGPSHPDSQDGVKNFKAWAAGESIKFNTPIQSTPGGGLHVVFRAPTLPDSVPVPGSLVSGVDIKYRGGICTGDLLDGRAYKWIDGHYFFEQVMDFPYWISRRIIDTYRSELAKRQRAQESRTPNDGTRPGDDYQNRHTWEEVLAECLPGWFIDGERVYRTDKGKGVKATLRDGVFYIFTDAGLPGNIKSRATYNKFSLLVDAQYNGNFSVAAKDLRQKGYGQNSAL